MAVSENLVVRTITEYDPAVAAAIGRLLPEVNSDDSGEPMEEGLLRDIIKSPDRDQFVAELNGQIIGAAVVNLLVHNRKRKAYLDYFVNDATVRGQGVGYAIWQAACAWSQEKGAVKLNWTSSNPEAHRFYLRQGAVIRDDSFFEKFFDS